MLEPDIKAMNQFIGETDRRWRDLDGQKVLFKKVLEQGQSNHSSEWRAWWKVCMIDRVLRREKGETLTMSVVQGEFRQS